MKSTFLQLAILLLLATSPARAHESGSHKRIMGTVRSIDDHQLVVVTTGGAERTVAVDGNTVCRDESGRSTCARVKQGIRVVVTTRAKEKGALADEIRFSGAHTAQGAHGE